MAGPFKMKGMSFRNSPLADKGEVVSKTSPGKGWTKTKGTNIWAPPAESKKMKQEFKQLKKNKVKTQSEQEFRHELYHGEDPVELRPPYRKPITGVPSGKANPNYDKKS